MASYGDMCRAVLDYYTNPDDLLQYGGWEKVFDPNNTYSIEQAYEAIRNNPNIQVIERTDGTVVGWWNKSTGSSNLITDIGSLPNSNTAGGSVTSNALVNINTAPEITQVPGSTTFKIAKAPAVGERWGTNGGVSGAILTVMAGIKLGLTFDAALYEVGKYTDIFTDEQLEALNPDNWKQIGSVVDEHWTEAGYPTIGKIGRYVFDTLTYVGQDNSSQTYVDEDAFAYSAWYLQNIGLFSDGSPSFPSYVSGEKIQYAGTSLETVINAISPYCKSLYPSFDSSVYKELATKYSIDLTKPFVVEFDRHSATSNYVSYRLYYSLSNILDSYEVLYRTESLPSRRGYYYAKNGNISRGVTKNIWYDGTVTYETLPYGRDAALTIAYENITDGIAYKPFLSSFSSPSVVPAVDGVGKQSGAILPDFSSATDLESFKTLLKQQYPDMWDAAVTRTVPQPDGTLKTFTYVPVPTPNSTDWMDTQPTGDGSQQSQKDTVVNPDMDTSIKDTISSSSSNGPTTPNPPYTGGGDSPTVVPPVGKASSLWSIYNPTLEQVNQFGSWLWSSNFVEQLKKLFNDPMQAIIGLHKVYSPVQTSGQGTIKCGYLDSEVPSKLVSEQYVTVDCGSVDLQEYFGNVFDYPPYTEVSIYLPFIGVRHLDPSDVMRSTISVTYHIDVLTGACLAEVKVQRDAAGGTLYTFSGDAAVRYPVSSGSYMGIVSGLIGVATSVVSGNILPALSGVTRLHTNVDRSGSFTGNAGAMGSKIPYLIISRPQTAMADKFETLSGYPSNTYTPLSACTGFTQVKFCHVENLTATDSEKQEIEQLLKEGVIL